MNPEHPSKPFLVLFGLATYTIFLIATVPAAWVGELIARASHGQARLLGIQGSFWNGSGTLVVNAAGASSLQNRVQWDIHPLWLLVGQLRTSIQSEGDVMARGTMTVAYQRIRLQNLSAELSATHAQAFYAPAMLVSPTGNIKISGDDVAIGKSGFQGELRITWLGAGSKLGAAADLGDYLIVATGDQGAAAVRAETLRGDVRIDAKGSWQAATDGSLSVDGQLRPGNREGSIGALLAAVRARKEGDHYPFRFTTRAPIPAALGGSG